MTVGRFTHSKDTVLPVVLDDLTFATTLAIPDSLVIRLWYTLRHKKMLYTWVT